MRYDTEESSFSPMKFGLIAAVLIAIGVAAYLYYDSVVQAEEALQEKLAAAEKEASKLLEENRRMEERIAKLTEEWNQTSSQFKKQLMQKESLLTSTKREKDAAGKEADLKLEQARKEIAAAEKRLEDLKKEADSRTQELKQSRDQIAKVQSDLKRSQADLDRVHKNYQDLQKKVNKITEGDQAAADIMVQQLSEARRQLRQEQEARQKLQQELDRIRQQTTPQ